MAGSRSSRVALVALGLSLASVGRADPTPLILTQTVNYGGQTFAIVDGANTPGASATNAFNGNFAPGFNQFDTSLGVLTGVTLVNQGSYTSQVTLGAPIGGTGGGRRSTGSGSGSVDYSMPTVTATVAQTAGATCTAVAGASPACATGAGTLAGPPTVNANGGATASVGEGALGNFAGNGTFSVSRIVRFSALEQLSGGYTNGTARYDFTVGPGTLSVEYQYLQHASGAFGNGQSVLTLDFGTVARGATIGPLGFEIANAGGTSATGLNLNGLIPSGDNGTLGINYSGFTNLAAGSARAFFASLDTSEIGQFAASYRFLLSDSGIGVGQRLSEITLNLMGNVQADVSEPASLALFWLGVIGLAARRRRFR